MGVWIPVVAPAAYHRLASCQAFSLPEDADPRLLFRTEKGILKKAYRQPVNDWAKPIFDRMM